LTDRDAARAELARRLRELYDAGELVETAVARLTGFSQSKVSRFLNGRSAPSPRDAESIALALGAGDGLARELADQAAEIERVRTLVTPTRVVLQRGSGSHQRRIMQMERDAARLVSYDPTLLSGLLQTDRYMRAVARAGAPEGTSDADIADFVRARRERQDAMAEAGRRCLFVLPETVLLWPALLSYEEMAEQCEHLARLVSERPDWEIRIIPRSRPQAGRPIYVLNGFDLYERDDESSTVLIGTTVGNALVTDARDVDHHRLLMDRLLACALPAEDSQDLLLRVASEYRAAAGPA
jgi:transcriptional regulator with XRE-family HTH domain